MTMNNALIELRNVSIDFPIYHLHARSFKQELIRLTTGGNISRAQGDRFITVNALSEVSFSLEHGDRVALIGHNGAGKSTLLRLLAQIYEPTKGELVIQGKVSTLLDLMLGINPESTGHDNIILRGLLLGLSYQEIREKTPAIADFTELGDYLNMPVRTYSSGMQLRLAFGVATSIHPEILLMDEILGVGDAAFIQKAEKRLNELVERSSILVLASHATDIVRTICNKGIVMFHGKVHYFGPIDSALAYYAEEQCK